MPDPVATYRIQLNKDFDFNQAAGIIPYLKALGISHVYLSPCFKAVSGSSHGYDITDFNQVNPELGGEAAFDRFCQVLDKNGLGQMIDVVPNHMAAHPVENSLWRNVLIQGVHSPYADFFDIRWQSSNEKIRGKILLPVLGDHYETCLSSGDLKFKERDGEIVLTYFANELPLSEEADESIRHSRHDINLKGKDDKNPAALDGVLQEINASPDHIDDVLKQCHYRLAYWQTASSDINYRRFFDINELVGLRMEKPLVFNTVHRLVLKWYEQGLVDGFRVDHPDGLRDPKTYFSKLVRQAPSAWVVAEKILESEEKLPENWPVSGTTGYDFLNKVNGLFVDPASQTSFTALYHDFAGPVPEYEAVLRQKKHLVMTQSFSGEIQYLVELLMKIRLGHRAYLDIVEQDLSEALKETLACFPVYRTYVRPSNRNRATEISIHDIDTIKHALAIARAYHPKADDRVWDFLEKCLTGVWAGVNEAEFTERFQQLTGPVMAKGAEDTAFYCFNRLLSLNEVGGNPGAFGTALEQFHRHCKYIQEHYPKTMSATSTHDTKRGEDTRMRINLLSEIPGIWTVIVKRWREMTAPHQSGTLPDAKTQYVFFQTLVGTWPIDANRMAEYMLKAVKEAKEQTSWTDPDKAYEQILSDYIHKCLSDSDFMEDVHSIVSDLKRPAQISSLSQTLVKCTAPGIPDFYQGSELWHRTLVDPDNRLPVDYAVREKFLSSLADRPLSDIMGEWDSGLPKLHVIQSTLALRQAYPEVFGEKGSYRPIHAGGSKSIHVVAFARGGRIITVVPRLLMGLDNDWADTTISLPGKSWQNVFTQEIHPGGEIKMEKLLTFFPVALLVDADI